MFLEREEGTEKERKRNINMREKYRLVAFCTHPDWGPTHNPGVCPDWNRT